MSYDRVNPAYYQTFQQDTPYHPGAEGWQKAPWVTWGENPQLAGRRRLATDGLGAAPSCGCSGTAGLGKIVAISGLGATNLGPVAPTVTGPAPTPVVPAMPAFPEIPEQPAWRKALGALSGAACAYHGFKRNDSAGWAVAWATFGSAAPFLALPIALAQGFGKPSGKRMTSNPRRARRR